MSGTAMRSIFTGAIAVLAVGGGVAYALIAQQTGHSPEPPAWLSLLIGGAVTYYYGQTAHLNGSTAALTTFAAAVSARRATDLATAVNELVAHPSMASASAVIGSPPPAAPAQGG